MVISTPHIHHAASVTAICLKDPHRRRFRDSLTIEAMRIGWYCNSITGMQEGCNPVNIRDSTKFTVSQFGIASTNGFDTHQL